MRLLQLYKLYSHSLLKEMVNWHITTTTTALTWMKDLCISKECINLLYKCTETENTRKNQSFCWMLYIQSDTELNTNTLALSHSQGWCICCYSSQHTTNASILFGANKNKWWSLCIKPKAKIHFTFCLYTPVKWQNNLRCIVCNLHLTTQVQPFSDAML